MSITKIRPIVAAALCAPLGLAPAGCIVVSDGGSDYYEASRVSGDRMQEVVRANQRLSLGMGKGEALGLYPGDLATLKSSARVGGAVVEEWRVQAYDKHDGVLFRRWLYFVDGSLAEFSDDRIAYAASGELPERWR